MLSRDIISKNMDSFNVNLQSVHVINYVSNPRKDFSDTSKFILRLLILLYGKDSLIISWDECKEILKKEYFKNWLFFLFIKKKLLLPVSPFINRLEKLLLFDSTSTSAIYKNDKVIFFILETMIHVVSEISTE